MKSSVILVAILAGIVFIVGPGKCGRPTDADVAKLIGPIREKYNIPALGGALLNSTGLTAAAVVGVRKRGTAVNATVNDLWHLGACTQTLTATMVAALVEKGKISWNSTLATVFPGQHFPADIAAITLLQLLAHRSGLPTEYFDWYGLSQSGSLMEQRRAVVAELATTPLMFRPGEKFSVSHFGYVVAAAMAEQVTGIGYEDLMQVHLFEPLHMESAGYGPMGRPGKLDEPWGHNPWAPAVQDDYPLVFSPAGLVHLTLQDWSRFVADQIRGSVGRPALLKSESYVRLHTSPYDDDYALGWGYLAGAWEKGQVLASSGSNGMHMAVVLMAPYLDSGILVVTNHGDSLAACNEAALGLVAISTRPAENFAQLSNLTLF